MKVFISHSSKDVRLAKSIVDLIRKSTTLSSTEIRCTSVDGYRLPGGALTNEAVRAEVHDAELLIGLITPNALKSLFVAFELGARWGAGKLMITLLASGATVDELEGPLAGFNALECNHRSQVIQFAEDVARCLKIPIEPTSSFDDEVAAVLETSIGLHEEIQQAQTLSLFDHITTMAEEILLDATDDGSNGFIRLMKPLGGV